jgi:DNA-binding MarR family transcriptional regulator
MSQKNWFILKTESQLNKLKKLLEEHSFIEMSGESIFVRLGYKNLSLGDKETYFFLRELALFSKYKNRTYKIDPSLDYLAKCLGTSINTQTDRIKNLEQAELVKKIRRKYNTNEYLVNIQPPPDSTFVSTLVVLIRRKRVLNLVHEYSNTNDVFEKNNIVNKLNDLNSNFFYNNIMKYIPKVQDILDTSS